MRSERRQFIVGALALASPLPLTPVSAGPKTVAVRGNIICLTEELARLYEVIPDCDDRGHLYAVRTAAGETYPLLPVDAAAAVWMDERYRQRELNVVARIFPQGPHLEVIKYQSFKDGQLHDLDYFCDVCMISTHKPGPCECCQDPVVFRERPASQPILPR
ncbi:MAG: hypothetical protein RIR86_1780 [Acidobacteriota bacterium]|jgi:hypothetical protein